MRFLYLPPSQFDSCRSQDFGKKSPRRASLFGTSSKEYPLIENDRLALSHQIGITPLSVIPLVEDPLLQHLRKPLRDLSIQFDKHTWRQGDGKRAQVPLSAEQEEALIEEKLRTAERLVEKRNYYMKADVLASYRKLGHVKDLGKGAGKIGRGFDPNYIYFKDSWPKDDDRDGPSFWPLAQSSEFGRPGPS